MGVCKVCGGKYMGDGFGVSAGMTTGPMCRCPAGSRSRFRTEPTRTARVPTENKPTISINYNPQALLNEAARARTNVKAGYKYYLVMATGYGLIVISYLAFSDDYFWIFAALGTVGVVLMLSAQLDKNHRRNAAAQERAGELGREVFGQLQQVVESADEDMVPVSERPKSPCSNCGRLVIAGVPDCVWCGYTGFNWLCNSCGGVFVQAPNGLMYCGNCRDYWR